MTLSELAALAVKATPGPWHTPGIGEIHASDCRVIAEVQYETRDKETLCGKEADAEFIAACSPERIAAMIAAIEASRAIRDSEWGEASASDIETYDRALAALDAL